MPARLMALSCAAQNLFPFNCGVAWCMFSPCQENVSCLHCNLLIYWPWSPKQSLGTVLHGRTHRRGSWLREAQPPAHQWLICHQGQELCCASLPGTSALFPICAEKESPAAAVGARLWEGAGNMNFCRVLQGSQELLWGGDSENKELPLQEGNLSSCFLLLKCFTVDILHLQGQCHDSYFFSQLAMFYNIHWDGKLMFSPARASRNGLCCVSLDKQTIFISVASHSLKVSGLRQRLNA